MTIQIKNIQRCDTEANWIALDPVIAVGEIAVTIDTVPARIKIGDGGSWSGIMYLPLLVQDFETNDIVQTDVNGYTIGSGKKFNDSGTTNKDVWSAYQVIRDAFSKFELKGQFESLHNAGMIQGNIDDVGYYWDPIEIPYDTNGPQAIYHICSLGNGIILAGSYGGNATYGINIYRSTDWGKTFTEKIYLGTTDLFVSTFQIINLGNGIALCGVGIGNNSGNGNGDIYKTSDYGLTWTKVDLDLTSGAIFTLCNLGRGVVLAGVDGWSHAAEDGDIFKSIDYGDTWSRVNINNTRINCITYLGSQRVIAASLLNIYLSTDNGDTWSILYTADNSYGNINTICYFGKGVILLGTESGHVMRSLDNGVTFIEVANVAESVRFIEYIGSGIAFFTTSNSYLGSGRVYRSSDIGETWTFINIPGLSNRNYALRMCHAGNGVVMFGAGDPSVGSAAIFRSVIYEPMTIEGTSTIISKNIEISAGQPDIIVNSTYIRSYYAITGGSGSGMLSFGSLPLKNQNISVVLHNKRGSSTTITLPSAQITSGGITYDFHNTVSNFELNDGSSADINLSIWVIDSTHIQIRSSVVMYDIVNGL